MAQRLLTPPALRRLALAVLVPLLLVGCGRGTQGAPTGTVTVFAAASLSTAFPRLVERFEREHPGTDVTVSFGSSSALAQQILSGAPADVFASAAAGPMAQVVDAGQAEAPRPFARNTAAIAVARQSANRVRRLQDLGAPGVKVALCQPEVPCGALAAQVLDRSGVAVTPVTRGLDVRAVLALVRSGEVDAGIVYATDVRSAGDDVRSVAVPPESSASTTYPVAAVRTARDPALARAFVDAVLSPAGQRVLAEEGFTAP